jgi:hypothetical protein
MAQPMLADGRAHDIVPASEGELLDELRRFDNEFRAAGEPRIVTIYADPEADVTPKLWIGLGRRTNDATVAYQDGLSGAQSRGPRRNDKREIGYEYGDGYSEFHRSTLVPKEDALAAAREFFQTGRRPTNLDWVDASCQEKTKTSLATYTARSQWVPIARHGPRTRTTALTSLAARHGRQSE